MNSDFVLIVIAISQTEALLKMILFEQTALSDQSLQVVVLHGNICKQVRFFLAITISQSNSNTRNAKRTINTSKTNIGVVTKHLKTMSDSA